VALVGRANAACGAGIVRAGYGIDVEFLSSKRRDRSVYDRRHALHEHGDRPKASRRKGMLA